MKEQENKSEMQVEYERELFLIQIEECESENLGEMMIEPRESRSMRPVRCESRFPMSFPFSA